jgi:hypothetical protein
MPHHGHLVAAKNDHLNITEASAAFPPDAEPASEVDHFWSSTYFP